MQVQMITAVVLSLFCTAAAAQDTAVYQLKRDTPLSGSKLLTTGAVSPLPFDKRYAELTPDQQARIKAQYESMGPGDEPPYPVDGLRKVSKALIDASDKYNKYGELRIVVDVDPHGMPTRATVLQTPDKVLATHMSAVLLKERYKPALCDGKRCSQQFLFNEQSLSRGAPLRLVAGYPTW